MSKRFAIKVIWSNGQEEFVREGIIGGPVAGFSSRKEAIDRRDFFFEGMSDEVQSVNIVPYPKD